MSTRVDQYVPALYWRQAEYQALFRLPEASKRRVIPLITVPDIEFDFEEQKPKKTLDEHLVRLPDRFWKKWGARPAWIDTHPRISSAALDDGRCVLEYFFDEVRVAGSGTIPVVGLDVGASVRKAVKRILRKDGRGVAIRIRLLDLMRGDISVKVDTMLSQLQVVSSACDLLLDLGAPNYQPMDVFVRQLDALLPDAKMLANHRAYALVSCGFPQRLGISTPGGSIPRSDWALYCQLRASLQKRRAPVPLYGDYAIVHPEQILLNPKLLNPSGKVVYTTEAEWIVKKGTSFRDNRSQMHTLAQAVVSSGHFRGIRFSDGDAFISRCARREDGPSSLTRWKEAGISHHIMQVLDSLAMHGVAA